MTVIETIDLARDLLNEPLASGRSFPDDSSSFYEDSTLLGYFNREQQILQNILVQSHEHFFVTSTSIDIVADTDEYSLASGVMKLVRVEWIGGTNQDPIEIMPMSFNEKELHQGLKIGVTAVGDVRTYAIKGDSLLLRPKPKSTQASGVKYYYVQRLPDLASGTSTSPIPPEFHEAISWGIYKRSLIQQEASAESVTVALAEYNRLISEVRQWAENRQIQRPRFVKRRKFRGIR
jgi:hypothetical protein